MKKLYTKAPLKMKVSRLLANFAYDFHQALTARKRFWADKKALAAREAL